MLKYTVETLNNYSYILTEEQFEELQRAFEQNFDVFIIKKENKTTYLQMKHIVAVHLEKVDHINYEEPYSYYGEDYINDVLFDGCFGCYQHHCICD